jgi:peptidoglycan/xylan/chitin deacetylase (PgdA/CDA1 family)
MGMRLSPTRLALAAARTSSFGLLVELLERIDPRARPRLPVLTYHRVVDPKRVPHDDPSLISATPQEFRVQMEYLAARRRVLSLSELRAIRRGDMELPPDAVAITFDDAYEDFAEHAWPVLRRLGLPVTLFVPTAYPDHPELMFWWDRLYGAFAGTERRDWLSTPFGRLPLLRARERAAAFKALAERVKEMPHERAMAVVEQLARALGAPPPAGKVLAWAELRELAAAGVSLAPHTRTHPRLDRLPLRRAREEIVGSAADLWSEIGDSPPVLAFPSGSHTEELIAWLPEAGFELAFTADRGSNDPRVADWLRLRRINVGRRSALPAIRAQLLCLPARAQVRRVAPGRA